MRRTFPTLLVSAVVFFASAQALAAGRSNRIIIREKVVPIIGLDLRNSSETTEFFPPLAKPRLVVEIEGSYSRPGWRLLADGAPVALAADNTFHLPIPILQRDTPLDLEAIGPSNEKESERVRVMITKWKAGPGPRIYNFNPILSFRLFPVYVFQKFGGFSVATGLSWNPTWHVNRQFRVSGVLGAYLPNIVGDQGFFMTADAEVSFGWKMNRQWEVEGGGGAQYWVNYGGLVPTFSASISYLYQKLFFNTALANRIFIGYSVVPAENYTQNIRVGIGFIF